jgi:hypothetical protein
LFQDIVDAIGTAARVLAEDQPVASSRSAEPLHAGRKGDAPSFQEIQDWLRRMDAKKTNPQGESNAAEFGRAFLRRAG